MWCMIESLRSLVDALSGAFTRPSFATATQFLLGWVMCFGKHTLGRAAQSAHPHPPPAPSSQRGLDGYYNFFERSAWTVSGLAYHVAVLVLTRLRFFGRITLLVDDTLAHKRGQRVWGMGWWRDAVASTKRRVATASGHTWVVLAVAYCLPGSTGPLAAAGTLASAGQGSAQLCRPGPRDAGRGAGLVPRPLLYPCGRRGLRLQGTAGRSGPPAGGVRRPAAGRCLPVRPAGPPGQEG